MAGEVYAAPTELAPAIGWSGCCKDIAPTELGAALAAANHGAGGVTANKPDGADRRQLFSFWGRGREPGAAGFAAAAAHLERYAISMP